MRTQRLIEAGLNRLSGGKNVSGAVVDRELGALTGLDSSVLRAAAQISYATSDAVAYLLDGLWILERQLPRGQRVELIGPTPAIVGSIDWPRSLANQGVSREGREEFYCVSRSRTNDTPPARLLKALLLEVARARRHLGLEPFASALPDHVKSTLISRHRLATVAMRGRHLSTVTADCSSNTVRHVTRSGTLYGEALSSVYSEHRKRASAETMSWIISAESTVDLAELLLAVDVFTEVTGAAPRLTLEHPGVSTGPIYWAHPSWHGAKGRSAGLWCDGQLLVFARNDEPREDAARRAKRFAGGRRWKMIENGAELRSVLTAAKHS